MDGHKRKTKEICIAWFSGTGCTQRVKDYFIKSFTEKSIHVQQIEINQVNLIKNKFVDSNKADLFILLFPVYACTSPELVNNWIKHMPRANLVPTVVVSVSGGGEISPNTACRVCCIKELQHKGYITLYEKMIVMPSNFVVSTKKEIAAELIKVLPKKVNGMVQELLKGKVVRSNPKSLDRLLAHLGKTESVAARCFGRFLQVSDQCNKCGLCAKKCPQRNIRFNGNKPVFQYKCMLCLKCIYQCPKQALTPGILKFVVLKDGFHLDYMEEEQGISEITLNKLTQGYAWSGIRKYLND
jgi:ferredoxin